MKVVTRRAIFSGLILAAVRAVAGTPATNTSDAKPAANGSPLRGTLNQDAGKAPVLALSDGRRITLEGDDPTTAVLNDVRLKGADFEVIGHFVAADRFRVNGMESPAMFVHKNGKRLMVTYWCNVCYIRTYSPGNCVCCQKYTDLDLIDPSAAK